MRVTAPQCQLRPPTAASVITLRPTRPRVSSTPGVTHAAQLAEQHLSLVGILVSERMRTVPAHVRRDDLMSAGMLALVLSAAAFDPSRGSAFRSFAAFRIRGALIDELRSMDWASRSVRSRAREIETVRLQLAMALDRAASNEELAAALGVTLRDLDAAHADLARGAVLSLQSFDNDTADDIPVDGGNGPEELLLRREQLGYLHDAIATLPDRLRFVVIAHYFDNRQMCDIALELSVTQSRVSQMCAEATSLIRDGMNSQLDPEMLRPLARNGRAATARTEYYHRVAARNSVAGRLEMSTPQGDMRCAAYAVEPISQSRIA